MAKDSIRDYSAVNSENTDIQSIDISEGCSPAGINNAIREVMADIKDVSTGTVSLETPSADQLNVDNLRLDGNTISSTDTNGNITIDPNGTGNVTVVGTLSATALISETPLSNRNLVINGAMQVAARGTSETGVTSGGYKNAPDRFELIIDSAGTWTVSQSTTAPEGFGSSYKLDCTVADASLAANDYLLIGHKFEGQNLQQLKKGTSNAQPVTLSFWVRSAKTGTYVAELRDNDNSRQINKPYTISSANTWEYKTITYDGDTTGALDNDANNSFAVQFWLAAGSTFSSGTLATSWEAVTNANRAVGNVNLADSTSNDFYITGVQLELGEATPFEHRRYGEELAACQRYYTEIQKASGQVINASTGFFVGVFPTEMRTTPTASVNAALSMWQLGLAGSKTQSSANISVNSNINSASVFNAECANFSGLTTHQAIAIAGGDQPLKFDAEL